MDTRLPPMSQKDEWAKGLTPELRKHFENVGQAGVECDVSHHNYKKPEKHFAALAWLAERRERKEQQETARFRMIVVIAALTLLATIVGILATKNII